MWLLDLCLLPTQGWGTLFSLRNPLPSRHCQGVMCWWLVGPEAPINLQVASVRLASACAHSHNPSLSQSQATKSHIRVQGHKPTLKEGAPEMGDKSEAFLPLGLMSPNPVPQGVCCQMQFEPHKPANPSFPYYILHCFWYLGQKAICGMPTKFWPEETH